MLTQVENVEKTADGDDGILHKGELRLKWLVALDGLIEEFREKRAIKDEFIDIGGKWLIGGGYVKVAKAIGRKLLLVDDTHRDIRHMSR